MYSSAPDEGIAIKLSWVDILDDDVVGGVLGKAWGRWEPKPSSIYTSCNAIPATRLPRAGLDKAQRLGASSLVTGSPKKEK